jgi:hypothetical protein
MDWYFAPYAEERVLLPFGCEGRKVLLGVFSKQTPPLLCSLRHSNWPVIILMRHTKKEENMVMLKRKIHSQTLTLR